MLLPEEGRARTGERQVGDAGQRRGEVNAPRVVEGHRQGRAEQVAGVRERQRRVGPQPGITEGDVDGRGDRAEGEGVVDRGRDAVWNVALALIKSGPVPSAALLPTVRVPADRVKPPEKVFAALSVVVPAAQDRERGPRSDGRLADRCVEDRSAGNRQRGRARERPGAEERDRVRTADGDDIAQVVDVVVQRERVAERGRGVAVRSRRPGSGCRSRGRRWLPMVRVPPSRVMEPVIGLPVALVSGWCCPRWLVRCAGR